MSRAATVVRYAALRRLLRTVHPAVWQESCAAWQAWIAERQARLPTPSLPRACAAVPIQTLADIPLYAGLLQLLHAPGLFANVVFVLPNRQSAQLAHAEAMLEGWAQLATIITEADWTAMVSQQQSGLRLIQFHMPASFERAESWQALASCARPSRAVTIGPSDDDTRRTAVCSPPSLAAHLEALVRPMRIAPPPPVADVSPVIDGPMAVAADALLRPHSLIIPDVAVDDLIAVTTEGHDGQTVVTALRPASLREQAGALTVPLPPRFASRSERPIEVCLIGARGEARRYRATAHTPPATIMPWMVSAYLNRGGAGNPVVTAFARGAGCRLAYAEDELSETEELRSIPVVWGVLRGSDALVARAKAQDLHFYYIDHAYFDRGHGHSYRITRNGYEAGPVRKCRDDRLRKIDITIHPWRKSGRSIIVCPPTDFFAAAHGCPNWLEETIEQLRLETDRPIIIRTKPQQGEPFEPLPKALEDAHALVTHSSNVAIEAACLGTPVFVSPTSAAAPIGCTSLGMIESPRYPKRDGWLAHLAYSQFTLEEFASGEAWMIMRTHEEKDLV
jgi:hypothetical protein